MLLAGEYTYQCGGSLNNRKPDSDDCQPKHAFGKSVSNVDKGGAGSITLLHGNNPLYRYL
jgi:hypothetical protein